MSLLIWLGIILVSVTVHEWAHYIVARMQKVEVKAFSVGMGPIIWRRTWKGTEWRLSALPLGGYVDIDGLSPKMNDDGTMVPATQGFAALSWLGQIAILFAGPLSNFILAILMLAAIYSAQGISNTVTYPNKAKIIEVVAGYPAAKSGLQAGDVIVRVDGKAMPKSEQVDDRARPGYMQVGDALKKGGKHVFTVERAVEKGAVRTLDIPIVWNHKAGQLFGIRYQAYSVTTVKEVSGVPAAVVQATGFLLNSVPQAISSFGKSVFSTFSAPLGNQSDVIGPVGAVQIAGAMAKQGGIWGILEFAVMINLSLAVLNLLPIPGLDGGRILIVLINRMRKNPLPPEQEGVINFMGIAFVLLFMVLTIFGDVARFFR